MKRALAIADRAAIVSLRLLAALNVLFLAAFLTVTLLAVSKARAQEPAACTGKNLFAELLEDDPGLAASILAEAEAVENGEGLLWKIEKGGIEPSFLFGTMHVSDPRVVKLEPEAQAAFDASSTLVVEATEALDEAKLMAAVLADPGLMMFTDDTSLASLLTPEQRAVVEKGLSERGIPLSSVIKMKPWMIAAMVAVPACELTRKAAGAPVLDARLAKDALASGKEIAGLETVADQLGAMASLPMDFHIQGLVDTLKLGDRIDDINETMVALYLEGRTGAIWPFVRAVLPSEGNADAGFAAFEERMVTARNRTMADRAAPILNEGDAFVAVGALHLPGSDGLVALLRDKGFSVTAVQ